MENLFPNHYNNYDELTDSEKKFIPRKIWDKIMLD